MGFNFVSFFPRAVMQGIHLLFGRTGEILTEKSGNLNLGIPGIMYVGGIRDVYKRQVQAGGQLALQVYLFRYHGVDHGDLHGLLDHADGVIVHKRVADHTAVSYTHLE